jgi:hypothetical protein
MTQELNVEESRIAIRAQLEAVVLNNLKGRLANIAKSISSTTDRMNKMMNDLDKFESMIEYQKEDLELEAKRDVALKDLPEVALDYFRLVDETNRKRYEKTIRPYHQETVDLLKCEIPKAKMDLIGFDIEREELINLIDRLRLIPEENESFSISCKKVLKFIKEADCGDGILIDDIVIQFAEYNMEKVLKSLIANTKVKFNEKTSKVKLI